MPGWSAFAASKAALQELADSLRAEEADHGVRVTTIYPDATATGQLRQVRASFRRGYDPAQCLFGRHGRLGAGRSAGRLRQRADRQRLAGQPLTARLARPPARPPAGVSPQRRRAPSASDEDLALVSTQPAAPSAVCCPA